MERISPTATDEDIRTAVRRWIKLLEQERYAEAHAWLHHGDPMRWPSPEHLATTIRNYGFVEPRGDGKTFKVTALETAVHGKGSPRNPYQDVERLGDPCRGCVHFDLPLNGEWSDLTATLDFSMVDSALVFDLDDIHVM